MLMRVGCGGRALRWRCIGVLVFALGLSGLGRRRSMLALLRNRAVSLTVLSRHGAHHGVVMGAMHVMAHAGAAAQAERHGQC
jgi:hypothetical protein